MTATKMIYLAAAILPFGFVVLAAVLLARKLIAKRRADDLTASLIYSDRSPLGEVAV